MTAGPPPTHPAEYAPVRAGEDLAWDRLEPWLRAQVPELDGPFSVMQFPNGAANLTYLLRFGDTELVMRRPPFGTIAPGAHDMKREYRVLSKLWRHFDRAPRAYALCDDHDVVGSDFVVMQRCVGEVMRLVIPPAMAHHTDVARRMGLALTDAMAEMHLLDPTECGLGDLGRPDGFVARQVSGWKTRWDLVRPDPASRFTSAAVAVVTPLMDTVHAALHERLPAPTRVSFVHNDLKLDNCQFDPANPDRVTAIFDWDMTTLGDPLIDLGTLLSYWPDPSDPPGLERGTSVGGAVPGMATRAEVAERYAARTGVAVDRIAWYEAFALWKTAVVVQQLYHRWAVGDSTDDRMADKADRIPMLVTGAAGLLGVR